MYNYTTGHSPDSLRRAIFLRVTYLTYTGLLVENISLSQLKAENAKETEEAPVVPQAADDEPAEIAAEEIPEETGELGEVELEGAEKEPVEAWLQTDEQLASDGQKKPSFRGLKNKLRKKITARDEQIEQLRAELNELKGGGQRQSQPQAQPRPIVRPKLADFEFDEARYEAATAQYQDAVIDDKLQRHAQRQAQQNRQRTQVELQNRQMATAVDQHWERAAQLVADGRIGEDVFREADASVRQSINQAMPGQGDQVTDFLLSRIGEGSEKVLVHLGRNAEPMAKLQQLLIDDPNGISAAIYLGGLKSKITSKPKARASRAPKPGSVVNGDAKLAANGSDSLKKYKAAGTDIQKRIEIKYAAKTAGVDVSNW